jgi:hypothetical protein
VLFGQRLGDPTLASEVKHRDMRIIQVGRECTGAVDDVAAKIWDVIEKKRG